MAASWRQTMLKCAVLLSALSGAAAALGETPASPALAPSSLAPPPGASAADAALASITITDQRAPRKRAWLRSKFVSEKDLSRYCLVLDENWSTAPADRPVAIVIHGYNSTPRRTRGLVDALRSAGHPCGVFAYPNDDTLPLAAALLSRELHAFARTHPDRKLALVCHSTGGLVARACIENPALDPGNVARLIMIAPPTHGSQLARFACGTDIWEHWLTRKEGWPWTRVHDSIVDGLGEAAEDLCPESPFLAELNALPRNPQVRYTIILGTRAAVNDAELAWLRDNICERLAKLPGVNGRAERLDALLADIDEIVEGKGDGVVALKRGRLDGVEDTVVLPFCHLAIGRDGDDPELRPVYEAVLTRLE